MMILAAKALKDVFTTAVGIVGVLAVLAVPGVIVYFAIWWLFRRLGSREEAKMTGRGFEVTPYVGSASADAEKLS